MHVIYCCCTSMFQSCKDTLESTQVLKEAHVQGERVRDRERNVAWTDTGSKGSRSKKWVRA